MNGFPTTNGSARSSAIYRTLRNYPIKFLNFIRKTALTTNNYSPFINWQQTVVQRQREDSHSGTVGFAMRTRETPVFRLHPLEPFDGSSIPSLPRLKITLEQCLCHIVKIIEQVSAAAMVNSTFDEFGSGCIFRGVFPFRNRINQDGNCCPCASATMTARHLIRYTSVLHGMGLEKNSPPCQLLR